MTKSETIYKMLIRPISSKSKIITTTILGRRWSIQLI